MEQTFLEFSGILEPGLFQQGGHQTPVGESALQEIEAHESREPQPPRIHVVGQGQAGQDEGPGHNVDNASDGHGVPPFRADEVLFFLSIKCEYSNTIDPEYNNASGDLVKAIRLQIAILSKK
jgi:hypothetical protein